jgi:hypothetical protein
MAAASRILIARGGVAGSNLAACSPGGQHDQPAGQRQDCGQDAEGSEEPAGLSARFASLRRVGHLGGCPAGHGEALSGQLPLEGGVRGGLLVRGDLRLAPGLPHLAFGGRPPGVPAFVVGLGVGDGGQAGQVHRGQRGPDDEDAGEFGHGCLLIGQPAPGGRFLTTIELLVSRLGGAQALIGCPPDPWDVPLRTLGVRGPASPEVKTLGRRPMAP